MEPLDEKELDSLLQQWKAPAAPQSLSRKVLPRRRPWWHWLTTGTIRIPVPVGLAAVAILALWLIFRNHPESPVVQPTAAATTLADFQPVQQLEPRLIEANHESNTNGQK
jgi:hypothetical protein